MRGARSTVGRLSSLGALTRLVPRLPSPTNRVGKGINGTGVRGVSAGSGWGRRRSKLGERDRTAPDGAPLPGPPPQTAWGRENSIPVRQGTSCSSAWPVDAVRSAIEFSPLREERAGRGRGKGPRAAGVAVCVRDARPQGRDTGAHARAPRSRADAGERWWLGAVGNSRIVAYGARSPARSAAEGHAQIVQLRYRNQKQLICTSEIRTR